MSRKVLGANRIVLSASLQLRLESCSDVKNEKSATELLLRLNVSKYAQRTP